MNSKIVCIASYPRNENIWIRLTLSTYFFIELASISPNKLTHYIASDMINGFYSQDAKETKIGYKKYQSCSPPPPLPRPPKYCGLFLAVSKAPKVIKTPAIIKA